VDYALRIKASVIVRGIRAISDYEYELQMALMNRRLSSKVETVFMMPSEAYTYLSSRMVREVSALGGSVHGLVPAGVERRLKKKLSQRLDA
jgi:pantetheine-phosphate adenylyltransferase